MSKSVAKIALSSSRDIPFNRLVLSQANVRRIKAGVSIEELAAAAVFLFGLRGRSFLPLFFATAFRAAAALALPPEPMENSSMPQWSALLEQGG